MAGGTFGGGSGTSGSPYLVEDAADLNAVRNNLAAYYKQTADIDLSGYSNWFPIATDPEGGAVNQGMEYFSGTYDGNCYKISNLTIDHDDQGTGLFGALAKTGVLTNVHLESINVYGGWNYVGGLVGYSLGTISHCSVNGGSISGRAYVGGLVGRSTGAESSINNCASIADVVARESDIYIWSLVGGVYVPSGTRGVYLGGLAGAAINVSNCFARGTINSLTDILPNGLINRSGFVGAGSSIVNCYCAVEITVTSQVKIPKAFGGVSQNSYFDNQLTSYADTYATGKTTNQLKSIETFVDWDFVDVWDIDISVNSGYPYLIPLITNVPVSSFAITESSIGIPIKETYQLNYSVLPENATDKTVVWTSSDENVATVDSSGLITMLTDGTAIITGTTNDGGFTDSCTIETPTPLPQVKQPTWADYKLTWGDVENASSYIVRLYNAAGVVVSTQTVAPGVKLFDFGSILSAGTFTATVQASEVAPE